MKNILKKFCERLFPVSGAVLREETSALVRTATLAMREARQCKVAVAALDKRCAESVEVARIAAASVMDAFKEAGQSRLLDAVSLKRDLSAAIDSAAARLEAVVNTATARLEAAVAEMSAAAARNADSAEAKLQSLVVSSGQVPAKMSALQNAMDSVRGGISALQSGVKMLRKEQMALQTGVEAVRKEQTTLQIGVEMLSGGLETMRDGLLSRVGEAVATAEKAIRTVNDGRGLYWYPGEVASAEARGLCDIVRRPHFKEEYEALVRGLPEESVATVNRTIRRLDMIKGLSGRIDIYTDAEKRALRKVEAMDREIVPLGDDVWCWSGYMLPKRHFAPNVFLYRYMLDTFVNPGAFCGLDAIDAGAYIGDSALVLAEFVRGRVHCFEPSPENHALLRRTIAMNGLEGRVEAVEAALGAKEGLADLKECADRSSFDPKMVPDVSKVSRCRVTTLDRYVAERSLKVGLVKVDVEGFERDFLAGAVETLKSQRPALLVSIYHNADDFIGIKPAIEAMGLGYKMRICRPAIKSVSAETLLVCEPSGGAA